MLGRGVEEMTEVGGVEELGEHAEIGAVGAYCLKRAASLVEEVVEELLRDGVGKLVVVLVHGWGFLVSWGEGRKKSAVA